MLVGAMLLLCVNIFALSSGGEVGMPFPEDKPVRAAPTTASGGEFQVLSELRDRGVLTEDEFTTATRKVLGKEQLQSLIELRDSGVLTDEEFENAARKIFWGR